MSIQCQCVDIEHTQPHRVEPRSVSCVSCTQRLKCVESALLPGSPKQSSEAPTGSDSRTALTRAQTRRMRRGCLRVDGALDTHRIVERAETHSEGLKHVQMWTPCHR